MMSSEHLREPSLEELDALLDEIDEIEKKKDEELRSETISKIPDTVIEEVDHEIKQEEVEEENNDLDNWIRSIWIVGSKLEIYQDTDNNWIKGAIVKKYMDNGMERLQIKYAEEVITAQRNDKRRLRPLSSALSIYKYVYDAIVAKNSNESSSMAVSLKVSIPSDQINVRRR